MTLTVSPTQQNVYKVLGDFIAVVTGLTAGQITQGLPNRTAMPPAAPGFISMTAVVTRRLRTNIDSWDEVADDPTAITAEQGTELRVQLDAYGAASGDWAVQLSTLLRDDFGCVALAGVDGGGIPLNPPICQPLYVQEPRMAPLVDSEDQYEQHWIVEAVLQYNPVTATPMEFANEASVTLINVDKAYPP